MGGSKNASALNSAGANIRLGGEWAVSAGRPPEEDTRGINQRIRREAGQAWGHQEQRQRSKRPGKRPLRPEAGSELPRRRWRADTWTPGHQSACIARGADSPSRSGSMTQESRQGRRDLHFRGTILAPEEPEFEEESREVEEEQGRYSNTCIGC